MLERAVIGVKVSKVSEVSEVSEEGEIIRTVISHWSLENELSGSVSHMVSEKSLLEVSMVYSIPGKVDK